jgi:hypothetical protein
MRFTRRFLKISLFLLPLFLTNTNAFGFEDDVQPQVTARVARIEVLSGDVQVRHADSRDWERATLNLPLVEGDEISSSSNARLEIQFDTYNYLRLSENAYLKITTLRDEGVAVSLPQGTMSLRVFEFNKDRAFFEIDAPKTTIAVQKAGMYRIDAGDAASSEIRVTVTEEGQARVYSESNGFTLRNGRSAKIFLEGNYEGESEVADASRFVDDFDEWTLERDTIIAKRLKDSYYDQYYDRDIYGADDLSEYGEWIYTRKHGYVWKPYGNSIARYANWSPYRYGHWRWIPPFGWTWVNDEPWGWATYHYGRWIYVDSSWYWTPYGYYRPRRSWWNPALVVIGNWGGYVCWYPLPYNYGYYNYNSYYYNNTTIINNTTVVVVNPTPTPNASPTPGGSTFSTLNPKGNVPPFQVVPPSGVVSVAANEFGTGKTGFKTAPTTLAEQVLIKVPNEKTNPPVLPSIKELSGKVSKEILAETPKNAKIESQIKTGVTDRQVGVSMNEKLQKERVLDNRDTPVRNEPSTKTDVRDTGAVKRQQPPLKQGDDSSDTPVRQPPQTTKSDDTPVRPTGGGKTDRVDPPVRTPRNDDTKQQDPVRVPVPQKENPPVYTPPTRQPPQQPQPQPQQPTKQQPQPQPKKEEQKPPVQKKVDEKDG